jgi:hypothetical protein
VSITGFRVNPCDWWLRFWWPLDYDRFPCIIVILVCICRSRQEQGWHALTLCRISLSLKVLVWQAGTRRLELPPSVPNSTFVYLTRIPQEAECLWLLREMDEHCSVRIVFMYCKRARNLHCWINTAVYWSHRSALCETHQDASMLDLRFSQRLAGCLLHVLFDLKDGRGKYFWNVCELLLNYTGSYPRIYCSWGRSLVRVKLKADIFISLICVNVNMNKSELNIMVVNC